MSPRTVRHPRGWEGGGVGQGKARAASFSGKHSGLSRATSEPWVDGAPTHVWPSSAPHPLELPFCIGHAGQLSCTLWARLSACGARRSGSATDTAEGPQGRAPAPGPHRMDVIQDPDCPWSWDSQL